MRQTLLVTLTSLLMIIFIPIILLVPLDESEKESLVLVIDYLPPKDAGSTIVKVGTQEGVLTMDLEEYLVGVVLSEMPPSFDTEALKAQAVAARTFACKQIADGKHKEFDLCTLSTCCQAWNAVEEMEQKFGNSAELFLKKAGQAVKETVGEVLCYNNEFIDAVYFSCSGGTTEDAVAVWGTEVPYLQSVASGGEELSSCYRSELRITHEQFAQTIGRYNSDVLLNRDPIYWIEDIERTEGDGVKRICIGGVWFSGPELRSAFGLKSTKFTVSVEEQDIVFHVLGYGHRVGMSQYGANAMAKTGKTYREILQYYYSGVEINRKKP